MEKRKINGLFALSVVILVLAIVALAFALFLPMDTAKADELVEFDWSIQSSWTAYQGSEVYMLGVPSYAEYSDLSGKLRFTIVSNGNSTLFLNLIVASGQDYSLPVPSESKVLLLYTNASKHLLFLGCEDAYAKDVESYIASQGYSGYEVNSLKQAGFTDFAASAKTVSCSSSATTVKPGSGTEASELFAIMNKYVVPHYVSISDYYSTAIAEVTAEKEKLQSEKNDLQRAYDELLNSISVQPLYGSFSSEMFYTTKKFSAASYSGYLLPGNPSEGSTSFGAKTIAESSGKISCDWPIDGSKIEIVPYFKCMGFRLDQSYPKGTMFRFSNVSDGDIYVGFAECDFTFTESVAATERFLNVIQLGELTEGQDFTFTLPKDYVVDNCLIVFFDEYGVEISTDMTLSKVVVYNDELYNSGYVAGQNSMNSKITAAYNEGFSKAESFYRENLTDYSFFGLISAVIDVPVKTLTSLLNFEILGVNMLSFFLGLLSFSIVLWIVKLFVGSKG